MLLVALCGPLNVPNMVALVNSVRSLRYMLTREALF